MSMLWETNNIGHSTGMRLQNSNVTATNRKQHKICQNCANFVLFLCLEYSEYVFLYSETNAFALVKQY